MNQPISFKSLILIALVLTCFALLPTAKAQLPWPAAANQGFDSKPEGAGFANSESERPGSNEQVCAPVVSITNKLPDLTKQP